MEPEIEPLLAVTKDPRMELRAKCLSGISVRMGVDGQGRGVGGDGRGWAGTGASGRRRGPAGLMAHGVRMARWLWMGQGGGTPPVWARELGPVQRRWLGLLAGSVAAPDLAPPRSVCSQQRRGAQGPEAVPPTRLHEPVAWLRAKEEREYKT